MKKRLIKIFFAIPCGQFFHIQTKIIREVCNAYGIDPVIVEDHTQTDILWNKITDKIDDADYFISDISSESKNTILELGYAMREKKSKDIGIFISRATEVPSDLRGQTLQIYGGFKGLKDALIKWIEDNILYQPPKNKNTVLKLLDEYLETIEEDFLDKERFLRLWSNPPFSSFYFTEEGLRFTNSDFPIMTNYLSLLQNYEFSFKAKVISGALGWVVKGTKSFPNILPEFCLMFNITAQNEINPHIYNRGKQIFWKPFYENKKNVSLKLNEWFEIKTVVLGDKITIYKDEIEVFSADFLEEPYKDFYQYDNKQGEVGFRCYPGEEAVINHIRIKEI